jgi:hypothetical protein
MDENAVAATRTANPRQQLAEQVTRSIDASNTDGASNSLVSQFTSNPFFTAVGHLLSIMGIAINANRDSG